MTQGWIVMSRYLNDRLQQLGPVQNSYEAAQEHKARLEEVYAKWKLEIIILRLEESQ